MKTRYALAFAALVLVATCRARADQPALPPVPDLTLRIPMVVTESEYRDWLNLRLAGLYYRDTLGVVTQERDTLQLQVTNLQTQVAEHDHVRTELESQVRELAGSGVQATREELQRTQRRLHRTRRIGGTVLIGTIAVLSTGLVLSLR